MPSTLINKIKQKSDTIQFNEVIEYIDTNYNFAPCKFKNGNIINEINQNNGSCKIFYFALLNAFSKEETLQLFGDFYRKDVLQHLDGTDHQNIRNFMQYGWASIKFERIALTKK